MEYLMRPRVLAVHCKFHFDSHSQSLQFRQPMPIGRGLLDHTQGCYRDTKYRPIFKPNAENGIRDYKFLNPGIAITIYPTQP